MKKNDPNNKITLHSFRISINTYHLIDLEMEKAKKIFINILFYCTLIISVVVVISPIIVIIGFNTTAGSLYFCSVSLLIFITFLFAIISYGERTPATLKPWQAKIFEIIFLFSLGITLLLVFLILAVVSSTVFELIRGPKLHTAIPCFMASFVIGILSKRRGWLYGILVASFFLYYITALLYLMGEANMPELTFFGHLSEFYAFPGTIFRGILILLGGIIGGLSGEFFWLLILKWRKKKID